MIIRITYTYEPYRYIFHRISTLLTSCFNWIQKIIQAKSKLLPATECQNRKNRFGVYILKK